jgi:hypothetical protein
VPIFLRHDRDADGKVKQLSEKGAQAELRQLRSLVVLDLCEDLVRLLLADHDPTEGHVAHLVSQLTEEEAWPEDLSRAQRAHPELADRVYGLRMQIRQAREVTAHSFRHALGTTLLEETSDLAAVQDLLGHADPGTTRRYSAGIHSNPLERRAAAAGASGGAEEVVERWISRQWPQGVVDLFRWTSRVLHRSFNDVDER